MISPKVHSRAFTLIELLVVTGIIVVIVAILLPAFSLARAHSRQTECANNLRLIGAGIFIHEQTYRRLPPTKDADERTRELMRALGSNLLPWEPPVLQTHAIVAQNLSCPSLQVEVANSGHVPFGLSYAMNQNYAGAGISRGSSQIVLVAEVNPHLGLEYFGADAVERGIFATRHSHMCNWLFFDGHVELLSAAAASGPHGEGWGVDQGQLGIAVALK